MSTVKVIIAETDGLTVDRTKELPFLRPEDITTAGRYRKPQDIVLHLVSAYLKRKYAGEWRVSEAGKPIAEGKCFNVSHTDGLVAIALADADVGIDAERIRDADDETRAFILSPEEKALLVTNEDFFRLWTAKESLVKADGAGFDRKPSEVPTPAANGKTEYKRKTYYSKQTMIGDAVLTATLRTAEPFEWEITKEIL